MENSEVENLPLDDYKLPEGISPLPRAGLFETPSTKALNERGQSYIDLPVIDSQEVAETRCKAWIPESGWNDSYVFDLLVHIFEIFVENQGVCAFRRQILWDKLEAEYKPYNKTLENYHILKQCYDLRMRYQETIEAKIWLLLQKQLNRFRTKKKDLYQAPPVPPPRPSNLTMAQGQFNPHYAGIGAGLIGPSIRETPLDNALKLLVCLGFLKDFPIRPLYKHELSWEPFPKFHIYEPTARMFESTN